MSTVSALEYRTDFGGGSLHASRNFNQLRHTYDSIGGNRTNLAWNLTLRQAMKKLPKQGSSSMPTLFTMERSEARTREPLIAEHADGAYYAATDDSVGRYQNMGENSHMLRGLTRVSSGGAHSIDWQLNLRDDTNKSWNRNFGRQHQSFDMMTENKEIEKNAPNELKQEHKTVGEHRCRHRIDPRMSIVRRPDRQAGAVCLSTSREENYRTRRWAGCEGTQVGQWRHLIEDRRFGHKSRSQLQHETTLREQPGETKGSRICDNRSDGCLVEMMGNKSWIGSKSLDPFASQPPEGEPKLHHLSKTRLLPERNEDKRQLRMSKHPRKDDGIPETHQEKPPLPSFAPVQP